VAVVYGYGVWVSWCNWLGGGKTVTLTFFETGSHYVAQTSLKLLPQLPKCQD
jgi:hypothetical protein